MSATPPAQGLPAIKASLKKHMALKSVPTAPGETVNYDHGVLKRLDNPKGVPYFPYLSIYTDASMIENHCDIWNDNFRLFMLEFLTKQVLDQTIQPEASTSCRNAE